jgi:hypothetical protein
MSNSHFIALDSKIKQLHQAAKGLDTNSLATYCFWNLFKFGTMGERIDLKSPARQILYLFGVASSTSEPKSTTEDFDRKMQQVVTLLNDIFGKYLQAYFPTKADLKDGLEEDWYKAREVAMPMFSSYFFEGEKIATDNFEDVIKVYFDGFESEITEHFGLEHHQILRIGTLIGELIQAKFDRLTEIMGILKVEHEALQHIKPEEFSQFMCSVRERTGHLAQEYQDLMEESISFNFESIKEEMGSDVVDSFLKIFVTERGNSPSIKYITDENPYSYKPIVTANNKDYLLPSLNIFYEAVILNLERFFKASKHAERFRKARDTRLEKESFTAFKNFLPDTAILFESIFETNDSHNEHDLVILNGRNIIIVEAKAAPRREPLRDPSKAYRRLRDDFKRNSGIQSASDQANNLRRLILGNLETPIYDRKGKLLFTIERDSFDNIYCICVTKDDFGMVATDLTLLLEKEKEEPYPWVISIQDLKFFLTCLAEIGLNYEYLIEYIAARIEVNGKALGNDELEFAGAYLNYGGFDFINKSKDAKVFLDISESRVFDEIHLEKINGRTYEHKIKLPAYSELNRREVIAKITRDKVKRNDKKSNNKEQKKARRKNR